jgi:hypothetical protein
MPEEKPQLDPEIVEELKTSAGELRPEFREADKLIHSERAESDVKVLDKVDQGMYDQVNQAWDKMEQRADVEEIKREMTLNSIKQFELLGEAKDGGDPKNDLATRIIRALMFFLKDLWLIGQYAAIAGERSRLQPLRKAFRPTLPDLQSLFTRWHRDPAFEAEFQDRMEKLGYSDEDITTLKVASEIIPNNQDVIRFAVRDIYFPDIVRRFDLDKHFNELSSEVFKDIDKIGMSRDTFKKYWMAHWVLPGISESFNMFHRDKINEDDLRIILRAQDIMPRFIEPIIETAYHPYTRVDVRRMNKIGVLNESQLYRAYRDLGYNDEKAKGMVAFTLEYNKDKDPDEKIKQRDLTKSDLLRAYRLRMFGKSDLKLYLKAIGYDDNEAEFYVDREDYLEEVERVEDLLKIYRKLYLNGTLNDQQLYAKLGELDLPGTYIDQTVEKWQLEMLLKTEEPTKSEILGFYRNDIITRIIAEGRLASMGYSAIAIKWYLDNIDRVKKKKKAST